MDTLSCQSIRYPLISMSLFHLHNYNLYEVQIFTIALVFFYLRFTIGDTYVHAICIFYLANRLIVLLYSYFRFIIY